MIGRKIKMTIQSSTIKNIHHISNLNVLLVEFKSGDKYEYLGVDTLTYQKLMEAKSKGTFLHKNIKGKFPYKKISSNGKSGKKT